MTNGLISRVYFVIVRYSRPFDLCDPRCLHPAILWLGSAVVLPGPARRQPFFVFQQCSRDKDWSKISPEDPGGESANPSLKLEMGAPDIYREDGMFKPRSQRQENANIGEDEGVPTLSDAPTGPWVESAKELIQPQPAPEVGGIMELENGLM